MILYRLKNTNGWNSWPNQVGHSHSKMIQLVHDIAREFSNYEFGVIIEGQTIRVI